MKFENPYLQPLEKLQVGEWDYYFTLAALYIEDGRPGRAVDSINKMFVQIGRRPTNKQLKTTIKGIKFLLQQNQIESASRAIDNLAPKIREASYLLELTEYLEQAQMDNSAKKTLHYAIQVVQNETELLELSRYFINKGRREEAVQALQRAISNTKDKDKLMELIKFAVDNKMDTTLNQGIGRTTDLAMSLEDYFYLVDYLQQHNRLEQASVSLTQAINSITRHTVNSSDKLLQIARMAAERGFYDQATRAIEKLSFYLGKKGINYPVSPPFLLFDKEKVPADEPISLPIYYAILQQKSGFMDKAENSYRQVVMHELDQAQAAFNLDEGLNNFFYLWQFYKEKDDYEMLQQMDFIYTVLEDKYLDRLKQRHELDLNSLTKEIKVLQAQLSEPGKQIEGLESTKWQLRFSILFHFLSAISAASLLGLMLFYCYMNARQYYEKSASVKTFAFMVRFFENIGWSYCMTIVGILNGLILVFAAQMAQIFHQLLEIAIRHENRENLQAES
jgi:tetratricopeptide (TPR) repeat protein